jgi:hypothetical protein
LGHVHDPAVNMHGPVSSALPGLAACRPFDFGLGGGFRDATDSCDLSLIQGAHIRFPVDTIVCHIYP